MCIIVIFSTTGGLLQKMWADKKWVQVLPFTCGSAVRPSNFLWWDLFGPLTDKVLQVLEGSNFEEPRVLQAVMMDLSYL